MEGEDDGEKASGTATTRAFKSEGPNLEEMRISYHFEIDECLPKNSQTSDVYCVCNLIAVTSLIESFLQFALVSTDLAVEIS